KRLLQVFEKPSMEVHADGIDEEALKEISVKTGGKYYPAKDLARLDLILASVSKDINETRTVTFPSLRPQNDGTARRVDLVPGSVPHGSLVKDGSRPRGSGDFEQVGKGATASYRVRGLVIAEMNHFTYLGLALVLRA